MSNNKFKQAIFDALKNEYENSIPQLDEHIFSPKFEKKMKNLINRRKKPYYKIINTVGKRVACIVIGIILASSVTIMSVDALRSTFIEFFVSIYEKFSTLQSINRNIGPDTIEEIYEISYDLSDYTITYEECDDYSRNITYVKDDTIIDFTQSVKSIYDVHLNTEDAYINTLIIGEHEAIYFQDNHNYYSLIWDNGEYIISLTSNIGEDALIQIANSVKKTEKN